MTHPGNGVSEPFAGAVCGQTHAAVAAHVGAVPHKLNATLTPPSLQDAQDPALADWPQADGQALATPTGTQAAVALQISDEQLLVATLVPSDRKQLDGGMVLADWPHATGHDDA